MHLQPHYSPLQPVFYNSLPVAPPLIPSRPCSQEPVKSVRPTYVTLLVYRKRHISTEFTPRGTGIGFTPKMVPYASVKPNSITLYRKCVNRAELDATTYYLSRGAILLPNGELDLSQMNPRLTSTQVHNGLMSKKANSKIGKAIEWALLVSEPKKHWNANTNSWFWWRCNLITLTLSAPQMHSDNTIKSKLLNHFLVVAARKWKVVNYIWRAESQANGNIHFHIVTDQYIHWEDLQVEWNRIQAKLGYITAFYKRVGHMKPNSTDVHSLCNVTNIAAYLTKYCSKNSGGITMLLNKSIKGKFNIPLLSLKWVVPEVGAKFFRQVHGKLWSCSSMLSRLSKFSIPLSDAMLYELSAARPLLEKHSVKFDYAELLKLPITQLREYGLHSLLEAIRQKFLIKKKSITKINTNGNTNKIKASTSLS